MAKAIIGLEEGWEFMERGISKLKHIVEGLQETDFSYDEYTMLYTTVYKMCIQKNPHNYSQQLYEKYKEAFEQYINSTVLLSLKAKHDEILLRELVNRWALCKVMVKWLSHFFHFLDFCFVTRKSLPSLSEVGMCCFRDLVYNKLKEKTQKAVTAIIDQEREGKQIERALLKNVLDIFVEIGMGNMDCYEKDFEVPLLDESAAYYSRKASNWIVEDSTPDYLLKAEECLKRERRRVFHYLYPGTEQKLVEKVQHELLEVHSNQLLENKHSGCRALLRDGKVDDLSRMYRLFCKIPEGLGPIANIFRQHVTAEGTALVQETEDATSRKAFIGKVIELHDKWVAYVMGCFANHALFHKALIGAFDVICNKQVYGSSTAELLASFCDNILRKDGGEKLSDRAMKETIDKVVKLLFYISDKDLYAEFYRKKLSHRLLFNKSASDDHERLILAKLKKQFGALFTSKMEGIVTDLTLARENQNHFVEYLANNQNARLGIDLTVTVLTSMFWPTYKCSDLSLPEEMLECVDVFKEFYEAKMEHRKLTWIYSLGTCNVSGNFESKRIELTVGTYQAAALLLFNTADKLSYSEIKAQLNLADDDLVSLLQSLSCAKYEILIKTPNSRTVTPSDSFEFNSKFNDRTRRLGIPLPPNDKRNRVVEGVDKDRRYAIDASIVRLMKSHKVLGHQQLVKDCILQLSRMFKSDSKAINERIEDLIIREYLERDKDNPDIVKYLA